MFFNVNLDFKELFNLNIQTREGSVPALFPGRYSPFNLIVTHEHLSISNNFDSMGPITNVIQ